MLNTLAQLLILQQFKVERNNQLMSKLNNLDFQFIVNADTDILCGADEVGRGAFAGPIVGAAVIINKNLPKVEVNDSKLLSLQKREELYKIIKDSCEFSISIIDIEYINTHGIGKANKLCLKNAIEGLKTKPNIALIDGILKIPFKNIVSHNIVKGDRKSASIAAASILAKVTRDNIMKELSDQYPEYGWDKNSGYGTKQHMDAILKYGVTKHHRINYKPISSLLIEKQLELF